MARRKLWAERDNWYDAGFSSAGVSLGTMFAERARLPDSVETSTCASCGAPIRPLGEAGWRHASDIDACAHPSPEPDSPEPD